MADSSDTLTVHCPQCRSVLQVLKSGDQVQPEDRIVCPVHGDLGSYAEFEPGVKKAAAEEAERVVKAALEKALRSSGIK